MIAEDLPFVVKRLFYIEGVTPLTVRGYHALHTCEQLFIPVSGSCELVMEDADGRKRVKVLRVPTSVYVPPLIWRTLRTFSEGSVVVVLASERYDADGYYRDRKEWKEIVTGCESSS